VSISSPGLHHVYNNFSSHSTILIGSSFFALNAATLTCAAIFFAISVSAAATAD